MGFLILRMLYLRISLRQGLDILLWVVSDRVIRSLLRW